MTLSRVSEKEQPWAMSSSILCRVCTIVASVCGRTHEYPAAQAGPGGAQEIAQPHQLLFACRIPRFSNEHSLFSFLATVAQCSEFR
jgi:hypothetical protein